MKELIPPLLLYVTNWVLQRGQERVGERESPCVSPRLPPTSHVVSVATSVHDVQRVSTTSNVCPRCALGRPWTSPFIDTRRCPVVQGGVAMWLAEKRLEPCTRANVAVREVP
jgi:hypothetical protein